MKKLAAGLLAFALMVMLLPAGVVVSFAASGKLSFSDPTASVGDQISVTMKIAADAALGSSDVMLQYDADALEFVSGTKCQWRSRICPRHRFCGGCGPEDVQLYIKI